MLGHMGDTRPPDLEGLRMPCRSVHDDDPTAAHALEHRPRTEPQTEQQLAAFVRAPQRLRAAVEIGDVAVDEAGPLSSRARSSAG